MDRTGTTSTQVPLYFPLLSLHVSSKPQHGPILWPAARPQDSAKFLDIYKGKDIRERTMQKHVGPGHLEVNSYEVATYVLGCCT
jgi:hypothetical protein